MNTHKKKLEQDGYTILKNVLLEEDLENIRRLTDRIISYGDKELEDPFSSYYMRHRTDQGVLYDLFQRHPEFQELAKQKEILDSVETVLGQDIFLYENSLVYKPKGRANEVPWHQDFINRPDEPIKYIAWIALDNVNVGNGALKVIPGSHKLGFLPFHTVEGETHHTRLNLDGINLDNYTFVELEAGDVLIFNQLVLHSSDRVDVKEPRRAYRISYQGFGQIFTPRATPVVLRGGSPEALENKFNQPYHNPQVAQQPSKPNLVRRAMHKLGRYLQKV